MKQIKRVCFGSVSIEVFKLEFSGINFVKLNQKDRIKYKCISIYRITQLNNIFICIKENFVDKLEKVLSVTLELRMTFNFCLIPIVIIIIIA